MQNPSVIIAGLVCFSDFIQTIPSKTYGEPFYYKLSYPYSVISQILFVMKSSKFLKSQTICLYMDRVKRIWYLSSMRAAKVQASLRIRAVSPEPSLLAHTSSESRGTFRQKARSLAPLNGWACAVEICHDGMLEDTNSLDGAHIRNNIDISKKDGDIKKSILWYHNIAFNHAL